jgi:hypothetical protein
VTKTNSTGITLYSNNPALYGKAIKTTTADLSHKKLKGLKDMKVWAFKKTKGKSGYLPQLKVFANNKSKAVKSASISSAKVAAYY